MRRRLIAAAVLITAGRAGVVPAMADVAQPRVASADPVDWTPHALDGTVRAVAVVGHTVVVGGTFTAVGDDTRRRTACQSYLFAFDANTGPAVRSGPGAYGWRTWPCPPTAGGWSRSARSPTRPAPPANNS